jgi:hypothetical protein
MPLQVADTCAFVIKRRLMDKEDAGEFYGLLRNEIIWNNDEANSLMHIEAA